MLKADSIWSRTNGHCISGGGWGRGGCRVGGGYALRGATGNPRTAAPTCSSAAARSNCVWRFSQNCGVDAKPVPEAESGVAGYRAFACDDLADAVWRDIDGARECRRAHAQLIKLVRSISPGCTARLNMLVASSLMVVHDLDFGWTRVIAWPGEADAPLPIDPDGILPVSITLECFQAIAWYPRNVSSDGAAFRIESRLAACCSNPWNAATNAPLANISVLLSLYPRIMIGGIALCDDVRQPYNSYPVVLAQA